MRAIACVCLLRHQRRAAMPPVDVCAGAPIVGSLLRLNVRLGFAVSTARAHVVAAHMRQAHPQLRLGMFRNGLVVVAAAAKLLSPQVAAPVIVATTASTAHVAAVFHVQIRVSPLLAPCSAICLRFAPTSRLTLPHCQLQSVSLFMRFKLLQAPGARETAAALIVAGATRAEHVEFGRAKHSPTLDARWF